MANSHYWSISITPQWAQVGLWNTQNEATNMLGVSKSVRWETPEDLITAVDGALSSVVDNLAEDEEEPSKTVFGVSPSWVEDGQIKKEYLDIIRKICKKLELEPTGFVVHPESIAHAIKVEEGSPLTGIIIGIEDSSIDVTLFRLGNLLGTVNVGRSVSIKDDVIEALTRFDTSDPLPSRFLVYNGKKDSLEEVSQPLVSANWEAEPSQKINFLHTPKVEIYDPDKKIAAISLAGATEMGIVDLAKHKEKGKEDKEDKQEVSNISEELEESPEDLGFKVDDETEQVVDEKLPKKKIKLPKFTFKKPKIKFNLKLPKRKPTEAHLEYESKPNKFKKPLIILALLLVLSFIALVLFWWYVPKAEIIIFVSPQQLEENQIITLTQEESEEDLSEGILFAKPITIEVAGEKVKSTTGTKTVGEKAKGKVTVRNGTSQTINLKKGDLLSGPNSINFVIDQSASVSAALSPSSPGTTLVEVTGETIGADHNLASGEILSVANYPKSEVDAVVEEDITGGSSKEIVAVAQKDLDGLEEDLTDQLIDQGSNMLDSEIGSDTTLLKESVETTVIKKEFNHKLGDEAESVSLNLTLEIFGLTVNKSDMSQLSRAILEGQIPDGFVLRDDQIKFDFTLDEEEGGQYFFDTTISANLLPDISPDKIAQKVSGKHPTKAQEELKNIPGYSGAEIIVKPPLPGFLGNIPRNLNNISIEVVAQR